MFRIRCKLKAQEQEHSVIHRAIIMAISDNGKNAMFDVRRSNPYLQKDLTPNETLLNKHITICKFSMNMIFG